MSLGVPLGGRSDIRADGTAIHIRFISIYIASGMQNSRPITVVSFCASLVPDNCCID